MEEEEEETLEAEGPCWRSSLNLSPLWNSNINIYFRIPKEREREREKDGTLQAHLDLGDPEV